MRRKMAFEDKTKKEKEERERDFFFVGRLCSDTIGVVERSTRDIGE